MACTIDCCLAFRYSFTRKLNRFYTQLKFLRRDATHPRITTCHISLRDGHDSIIRVCPVRHASFVIAKTTFIRRSINNYRLQKIIKRPRSDASSRTASTQVSRRLGSKRKKIIAFMYNKDKAEYAECQPPGAFHLSYLLDGETRNWRSIRDSLCMNHLYRYCVQLQFPLSDSCAGEFLVPHS